MLRASLEEQLLQEYVVRDRTPVQSALFVSALSQIWVFAVLRTPADVATAELLRWAETLAVLGDDERESAVTAKRQEIEWRASEAESGEIV
jgi:hypothetical protein